MILLTPAGLNMFITASTDSLFMPLSQPGGAKLCEKIRKFIQILKHTETALFIGTNNSLIHHWNTGKCQWNKNSGGKFMTWGRIQPNSWLVTPTITGTFSTSFLLRSSSAVSIRKSPSTTAPRKIFILTQQRPWLSFSS